MSAADYYNILLIAVILFIMVMWQCELNQWKNLCEKILDLVKDQNGPSNDGASDA